MHMKSKLSLLTLVTLLACLLALSNRAAAQATKDAPAPDAPAKATPAEAAPAPDAPAADAPTKAAPAADAPAADAPAKAAPAADAPAAGAAAVVAQAADAPPAAAPATASPVAAPVAADTVDTNAPQPGAIIPLIVMDDVPLTDAIRNLARQASLNYMLDPKIGYGQPGPDGRAQAQPSVSIRWESVTAEQALTALLNNYNLVLTEDPKSKIARITVRDPAAPDPLVTRIIQLKFSSPTNMLIAVQNILDPKRSKVTADVRTSQLVVLATEKEMVDVDKLIDRLDTQSKQVLIEARLVETVMNPKTSKGIDWSGTLQAQHISYGNGRTVGTSTTTIPGTPTTTTLPSGRTVTTTPGSSTTTVLNSIMGDGGFAVNSMQGISPNVGFLNADGLHAVLSFLNEDSDARVLSEPRTVTLDNEPSILSVTRATPILNVTAGTANTTGGSQVTYTNLGVILHVTPRISANNFVSLKVVPEVSRLFDTVTKVVNGVTSQADEYDFRKMETHVMIPSGNTLVLGGLMQDDVTSASTKVPVLGDMPGLGGLFRSSAKQRIKSNLIVFITPTIVQDSDFQIARSTFLKTPMTDKVDPDWSSWDSTKPYDWSQKGNPNAEYDDTIGQPSSARTPSKGPGY
jgi:type II secretory pathway component GspD/PulD (secretin)